ncbi:unnamed protein product [Vitrella brassicaformis CCMP3155]|uniref:TLDc domain-containing protein n=1 Tax=Vitrella brassicaformis (strain CCMP3155) TaxID=1169540 RepID=A0A0G4EI12_VITBC|nr:unnamed protein product [Vitrella brassicaformis CCMP3155]|eukprot:CEL95623.1 unnamed protein product [Vitrella brassicaformis CCMP3155]
MSAAAAGAGGTKKRKNDDSEVADESIAPFRLHGVITGREEGDVLVRDVAASIDGLKQAAASAETAVEGLASEISQMILGNGGKLKVDKTSGNLRLNVGGTVIAMPIQRLLHPRMKLTYLSTLLLHFIDALPKDTNKLPYLEMHPPYFKWLRDQLALLESPHLNETPLLPPKSDDPSYAEYHSLFMQKLGGDIEEQPQAPSASAAAAAAAGGGGEQRDVEMADGSGGGGAGAGEGEGGEEGVSESAAEAAFREMEHYTKSYRRALAWLRKQKEGMAAFLTAMRPFVKGDSSGESDQVVTLTVCEDKVSVLRRTIAPLGPTHALVKRFDPTQWPDQDVHQTSLEFLQLTVDFARRLTVMPDGRFVHPPVVAPHEKEVFGVELGMYGLNTVPSESTVIERADEWTSVMNMTNKKIAAAPSLLYKGSRDTYAFPKMLQCVAGKSGLLFALRDGDTHRFGCFLDGPLTPPANPTQSNAYKVPVFFYWLSGAYDVPRKIEIPEDRQWLSVAGTRGAAKAINTDRNANMVIAFGAACLWLGWARPGQAADIRSCQLWINRESLPRGYRGEISESGSGTLAAHRDFTASEIEIWHIKQAGSG